MRLSLDGDTLRIDLNWWQRLLAFHFSAMEIPLAHIEGVGTERVKTHWSERRIPGSFIPGLLRGGHLPEVRAKGFLVRRPQPAAPQTRPQKRVFQFSQPGCRGQSTLGEPTGNPNPRSVRLNRCPGPARLR